MSYTVSTTWPDAITVRERTIKRSSKFTSLGWINEPSFDASDDPLILLAVSDTEGDVDGSEGSIKMELVKEGRDYRLQFAHSKSKLVRKNTGVTLDDKSWHMLGYVCHGEGSMSYYVDGISLSPEDGTGDEGVLYSIAWSRAARTGGGYVWAPYLYKKSQAVSVYHWRFGTEVALHQEWIQRIMSEDLSELFYESAS